PALALLLRARGSRAAPRAVREVPGRGMARAEDGRRAHDARGLRLVPEVLARLQRARRAGGHLGHGARGPDPQHPQARLRPRRPPPRPRPWRRPRVAECLLEVGFEEMPAPWLEGLGAQLQSKFAEAAAREFLEPREPRSYWTPRRLVLSAPVAERQADREE